MRFLRFGFWQRYTIATYINQSNGAISRLRGHGSPMAYMVLCVRFIHFVRIAPPP